MSRKSLKEISAVFKKIEIWILYLTILLSILFAIGFGTLVRQELVGSIKAGWISETALTLAEIPINIKKFLGGDLIVEDRFPSLMMPGYPKYFRELPKLLL